jgi:hypothetical protein
MPNAERYPFVSSDAALGEASFRPYLPFTLFYQQGSVPVSGLLDTGASVNVLPYLVGIELGYEWERQTTALSLTGNLAQYEARVVLVHRRWTIRACTISICVDTSYKRAAHFGTSQLLYGI